MLVFSDAQWQLTLMNNPGKIQIHSRYCAFPRYLQFEKRSDQCQLRKGENNDSLDVKEQLTL